MEAFDIVKYALSIIIVFLTFPLGDLFVNYYNDSVGKESHKSKYKNFLSSGLITLVIRFLTIIVGLAIAIKLSSIPLVYFITSLGVLGIVLPLSLQNPLQDFASGILLIAFDKVRVGDFIKIGEEELEGTIMDIGAFYSEIKNPMTNVVTDVPNTVLWSEYIESVYRSDDYKMKMTLLISNRNDIKMVERIIRDILKKDSDVIDVEITYTTNDHRGLHIDLAVIIDTNDFLPLKAKLYRDLKIGLQERGVIFVDGAKPVSIGYDSESVYPIIVEETEITTQSRLVN